MTTEQSYPVVRFLDRRGGLVAAVFGLLPVVAAAWAIMAGQPWWVAPLGVVAGGALWLLMRSYVEVIRIIAETLLPQ